MRVVRFMKAALAWGCIAVLVVFCVMNSHSTTVTALNVELTAPVSAIVALAAVLGALGAAGFKTMLSWTRAPKSD